MNFTFYFRISGEHVSLGGLNEEVKFEELEFLGLLV